ncbi:MAG: 2TM domain-containing protein [Candidatus Geothermincolia bacterium]
MDPEKQAQGDGSGASGGETSPQEKTSEAEESLTPEGAGSPIPFYDDDESLYFERLFAFKQAEDEEKQEAVRAALAKFNVFLHLTAYAAGVAYLLLLGALYKPALPWVFIPIALWTAGLGYHFYRTFSMKKPRRKHSSGEPQGSDVT